MSEPRQSLKRLENSIREMFSKKVHFEPLQSMKNVAETLEEQSLQKDMEVFSDTSIKGILQKIKRGESLTRRECRDLPFVMADVHCDKAALIVCLKNLDIARERILRKLIGVYFLQYTRLDENKSNVFRRVINKRLTSIHASNQFLDHMKRFAKVVFVASCTKNIARMIDECGLDECTNRLDLPDQMKFSELILESTVAYFLDDGFSLSKKMENLQEVMQNSHPFYAVFPRIADSLIKRIHESTESKKMQYRACCMEAVYQELDDPRFSRNAVRWNGVSKESKAIFLSWLAEKDLNLFFKIIEKTAVDDMWRYRKAFWMRYLPYIRNTWVFFGKEAMRYARKINKSTQAYGRLSKALTNQSVFAFQLGQYVFVEWSHNGSLRVWPKGYEPEVFAKASIDKNDITDALYGPDAEWRHAGKETGKWQEKVCSWIEENCGINPDSARK